uniref:Uncharacterized protein n=2 Tax=Florenciella parvula TaxID=236787 RepID=A0A7S2BQQ2_9STRA|mmetsp:Transcript_19421/g.40651  ORF Transcript_19421/g.40651 Transcript_19421/m.40651 type:complete len:109 (+) Transcript_19421:305-631(+)
MRVIFAFLSMLCVASAFTPVTRSRAMVARAQAPAKALPVARIARESTAMTMTVDDVEETSRPLLLAGVFIPVALAGAGQDAITGAGVVAVISAVWIFAFIKLLQKAGM